MPNVDDNIQMAPASQNGGDTNVEVTVAGENESSEYPVPGLLAYISESDSSLALIDTAASIQTRPGVSQPPL